MLVPNTYVIMALRRREQLTHDKLAERSGLSRPTLSLLERGVTTSNIKTIDALAKALKVSPHLLLLDTDPKHRTNDEFVNSLIEHQARKL